MFYLRIVIIVDMFDEDLSEEELKKLARAFKELKVKPMADSASDLVGWMTSYVVQSGEGVSFKEEPGIAMAPDSQPPVVTIHNPPRLPVFSGDGKGDDAYDIWRYEVQCLMKESHSPAVISQAIRRSLRGEAHRIIMRLGPNADTPRVLAKMESVYGAVDEQGMLLGNFYSARQKPDEDVSTWGCRLEDLLSKAIEKGQVQVESSGEMLRSMFWSGMQPRLKDISGHLYERHSDFDALRVAVRRLEQDLKRRREEDTAARKPTGMVKMGIESKEFTELKGMVNQLTTEVRELKRERGNSQPDPTGSFPKSATSNRQGGGYQYHSSSDHQERKPLDMDTRKVVCWRCGQEGHLQVGCRVRIDHLKRPLNYNRPASRGGR